MEWRDIIRLKYISEVFIICILCFVCRSLFAQERDSDRVGGLEVFDSGIDSLRNSSAIVWEPCISPFIEFLGKGFLTLNVDFRKKESYAISIGIHPFEGLFPNIMYYHFSGKRHRFELGGGFSTGFSKDFNLAAILIHGSIGYRYQKKKGLFFRTGLTPFYVIMPKDKARSNKFYPLVGLSLGYSF
jgi:hypothetical protein